MLRIALLASVSLSLFFAPRPARAASAMEDSLAAEGQGKLADALGALDRAAAGFKDGYVGQLRRGWLCYQLGRNDDAVRAYQRAVTLAPRAVEPKLGLLLPLLGERRFTEAQRIARQGLKLDPASYLATLRLAYAAYGLGQLQDALTHYQKVVVLYPSDTEARAGLGWTLLKLGRKAEAKAAFEGVLEASPAHASARAGLAELAR